MSSSILPLHKLVGTYVHLYYFECISYIVFYVVCMCYCTPCKNKGDDEVNVQKKGHGIG